MPRKKMPSRPKKSTAIKTPAKTAKEKKNLMPAVKASGKPKAGVPGGGMSLKKKAKEAAKKATPKKKKETFGKKIGSPPRKLIGKRRQQEQDLLDDL
jgi:hypothetical protein